MTTRQVARVILLAHDHIEMRYALGLWLQRTIRPKTRIAEMWFFLHAAGS